MATDVTTLLLQWRNGNKSALDALMPLIYQELKRRARRCMRGEKAEHTLQPTALVHDVYLRMVNQHKVDWQSRAHFLAAASQVIRHILIDHARARDRLKRGSSAIKVTSFEDVAAPDPNGIDIVALDQALDRLSTLDAQQSRVVELRFFGGLSIEEIAEALQISPATVKRDWAMARSWLYRELTSS